MKFKFRLNSIRNKILFPTIALLALGMGLCSAISYVRSGEALEKALVGEIQERTQSTVAILGNWLKDRKLDAQIWGAQKVFQTAVKDSFVGKAARKSANEQLAYLKEVYGYYENICLADLRGAIVSAADQTVIGKVDVSDRDYFKQALGGNVAVSDVISSRGTGNPIFVIAVAVRDGDQVGGVLFSVVDVSAFSAQFVDPIKVADTGYAYMYNEEGLIIAHPEKDNILKLNIKEYEFGRQMLKRKDGNLDYTFKGIGKKAAFKTVGELGWSVAVTAPIDEIMAPVKALGKYNLILAMIVIVAAAALVFLMAKMITKQLNQVVNGLRDAAEGDGDLTKRIDVRSHDEVGELGRWFNVFVEKIQGIIADVAQNSHKLNSSSKSLSSISQHMSAAADQTSGKATTVATASEEMSSNIQSVAAAMEQATNNINRVASASEEMTATINEIAQNTEKARAITEDAVGQAGVASEQVDQLGSAAKEIGKVIESITDISEQVNLLALNATIEAARAGEAGKGFAVVANEIKELARQTATATCDIKQRVEEIQLSTKGTINKIDTISKVVNDVDDIVSTIATAIEEQSAATREISGNVAQASIGIGEVNNNISQSAQVAGNIAGEIAEVNHAADDMSNSSAQVNLSSSELAQLAEQLNEMVGRFKV